MLSSEEKKGKIIHLERGNASRYSELMTMTQGRGGFDVSALKYECLITMLTELGLLSEDNLIDMELRFQERVSEIITEGHAAVAAALLAEREAAAQHRSSQSTQQAPAGHLLLPGGRIHAVPQVIPPK